MISAKILMIMIISIEHAWCHGAKVHHHLSRKPKQKRDDIWGQKLSDFSGNPSINSVINQNFVGADNHPPQNEGYSDFNTVPKQSSQDFLDPKQFGGDQERDYSQFMKISPQELNAAYQMVNSDQFEHNLNAAKSFSNDENSQIFSKQNSNWESTPKEGLNYVESTNLKTQSNDAKGNNFLGNEMASPNDGFKKSGVPVNRQLIPENETHPEGVHTHLTETAVITHKDNNSDFHGVSRYPPYVTEDGKSVSGPPTLLHSELGKSGAQNLPLQYNVEKADDKRCINYTTDICFHDWMKKHCAIKCKNVASLVEARVQPPLQNLTLQITNITEKDYPVSNASLISSSGTFYSTPKEQSYTTNSYTPCSLPSYGGNSYGSCCSVPFVFLGKPQYGCVLQPGLGYWCGTTNNFDQDQKWGLCGSCIQAPCPATTTIAPTTLAPLTTTATTTTVTTTTTTTKKPVQVCDAWTSWSDCSTSCGFGKRTHEKVCRQGNKTEKLIATKQCYMADCPPLCNPWSEYSECSKTCGGGVQEHKRNCSITDNIQVDVLEFTESRICNTKPCPTEWTLWSEWTECTLTCGGGYQERHRIGSWEDLGRMIATPQTQTRHCNTQECPPFCESWGEWSECSKSCNRGEQEHFRVCYSVKTKAPFNEREFQPCNQISCYPPYCGQWSAYTECTASCLGGIMSRWRTCDGVYDEQNITCNEIPCPTTTAVPRTCSEWEEWSPCSATCNGMQTRIHHCKNDTHESDELQARPCNTMPCWVTTETPTTTTSTSTTTTSETTTTEITTTETSTTTPTTTTSTTTPTTTTTTSTTTPTTTTTSSTTTTTTTPTTLPPPVTWSGCTEWSFWSECAQPCGGGYQERYRTCLRLQQDIETRACNLHPCITTTPAPTPPTTPIKDCIVAHWSFDNVDINRKVIFDEGPFGNHAQYNGDVSFLHGNFSCQNATLVKNGEIWFNKTTFQNVPANGLTIATWVFADSTTFSQSLFPLGILDFNIELEAGKVKWTKLDTFGRTYFLSLSDMAFSDQHWFHLALTYNATSYQSSIFINAVNVTAVERAVTSENAHLVSSNRFRGFIDELFIYNCTLNVDQIRLVANTCKGSERGGCPSPALGVCSFCQFCKSNGTTTPVPTTTTEIPPIDGRYGPWGDWGPCSVSCGFGGIKSRFRECNNPEPQYGGLQCSEQPELGNATDLMSCNFLRCPEDGIWCAWKEWSECSTPCGIGKKSRQRECNCPAPQFGGQICKGESAVEADCFEKNCAINGNVTLWSVWSPCSRTCSNGTRFRTRDCANPAPRFGGSDCRNVGPLEHVEECYNIMECPVDGNWSPWSVWSDCSRTCGDGMQYRNRSCTNPPPTNGGKDCDASPWEIMYCKLSECCDVIYKSIGCFKDPGTEPRPLPDLLFTDNDPDNFIESGKPIHNLDHQGSITDLICRCAKSAKNKLFTHFAIQNFGDCMSGPRVSLTYNRYGEENSFSFRPNRHPWPGCVDVDQSKCQGSSLTCIGMENTNFVYGLENAESVNGNYTEWSSWSFCSRKCGFGERLRTRSCTNPKPTFGGNFCFELGASHEVSVCKDADCPVNGMWSQWSLFSECSVSCGEGSRIRTRLCNSPSPSNGGLNCVGINEIVEVCELEKCKVDCNWSQWLQWSDCSVTCGNGEQKRIRLPNNPEAQYGGKVCEGPDEQVFACRAPVNCSEDGRYTLWSDWSMCSKTCGGGDKYRTRTCTNPKPKYGGRDCIKLGLGHPIEHALCNTACCPVHGNFSEWASWSQCGATCGMSEQTRTRKCNSPAPMCGGRDCSSIGPLIEAQCCKAAVECPINGNWSEFGNWSECSKSCGFGGIQIRQRTCNNPAPKNNGKYCFGEDREVRNCTFERSCCAIPYVPLGCFKESPSLSASTRALPTLLFDDQENVDVHTWDDFLDDLVCRCASQAKVNKYTHFGIQSLAQCYSGADASETYANYGPSNSCITTGGNPSSDQFQLCPNPFGSRPCAGGDRTNFVYGLNDSAINGGYTSWSAWSSCSYSCGYGKRLRYRTCTNPSAVRGGLTCLQQNLGLSEEEDSCYEGPCPVDCGWSQWSKWSECSETCGLGYTQRQRSPDQPMSLNGGKNCTGQLYESIECNLKECPINGGWSIWSDYSPWSTSCGNAIRTRVRACTNPVPAFGGKSCVGSDAIIENKNLGFCPVDGEWCPWESWSVCSRTCGLGNINRVRKCNCPASENGGKVCFGLHQECKTCNLTGCPVNGQYSQWTQWTPCDRSCGNGTKARSRVCSMPTPAFGGLTCIQQNLGEANEEIPCNQQDCPVDGNWQAWSEWSTCSLHCGEGRQSRHRTCTNPVPQSGGDICIGKNSEKRLCKLAECCDIPHKVVGCFQNVNTGTKTFSVQLINEQSFLGVKPWEEIMSNIICQCAQKSKELKYKYFGIINYAQCWSGPDSLEIFTQYTQSSQCLSMLKLDQTTESSDIQFKIDTNQTVMPVPNQNNYELCSNGSLQCAGQVGTAYVYSVFDVSVNDGSLTAWSSWSQCSKSCGGGLRLASRNCSNPTFDGADCTKLGELTKMDICNNLSCPVNGGWAGWSSWSQCSVSCGVGIIERIRNCSSPAPLHSGLMCSTGLNGVLALIQNEKTTCFMGACAFTDELNPDKESPWGTWSGCSSSCGNGERRRERNCTAQSCPCPSIEYSLCNIVECPVPGYWAQWTAFSPCSTTCGPGIQNRTRECIPPQFNGPTCEGKCAENRECSENPPCKINGNYTEWGYWGSCTKECGGGKRVRSRSCSMPLPQHGGLSCIEQNLGSASEEEDCNTHHCPVNCKFSDWTTWSTCTVCGYGKRTRQRYANPPSAYNGTECIGENNQTEECFVECCSASYQKINCYKDNHDTIQLMPEVLFNNSENARNRYIDWNNYLTELVCKCAVLTQEKKYTHFALQNLGVCLSGPDVNNTFRKDGLSTLCISKLPDPLPGTNASYLRCQKEDQHCVGSNNNAMFVYGLQDVIPVDCGYSDWGPWEACSETCGVGLKTRYRHPNNPVASYGGQPCSVLGAPDEVVSCQEKVCEEPPAWSSWSDYGVCSLSCGEGISIRYRECNNPPPQQNSGLYCIGNNTEVQPCKNAECSVDGSWSTWTEWSKCSKTCDSGMQNRNRKCNNPIPAYGGLQCIGHPNETRACDMEPCDIPPGEWGPWEPCSVTCGTGTRKRLRPCPSGHCYGDLSETEECEMQKCPVRCEKIFDLGFLVDFSGDASSYFSLYIKNFIVETALQFDISANKSHFAYLPYSTTPALLLQNNWFSNPDVSNLLVGDIASQRAHLYSVVVPEPDPDKSVKKGSPFLNRGLVAVSTNMFTVENGMRPDKNKALVIISNGKQDIQQLANPMDISLYEARRLVESKGVTIIAVAVGNEINYENLKLVASDPTYIVSAQYVDLQSKISEVTNKICDLKGHWGNWGNWTSCSATCGDGIKSRVRLCVDGMAGEGLCVPKNAENDEVGCNLGPCPIACDDGILDLGFIMDMSNTQTAQQIVKLVTEIAMAFSYSQHQAHFAYIPYGINPELGIPEQWFNSSLNMRLEANKETQREFFKNLLSLNYLGEPYPWLAAKATWQHMFNTTRPDVKHIAVFITDGTSGQEPLVGTNSKEFQYLKSQGIEVIIIAVGSQPNLVNLNDWASSKLKIFLCETPEKAQLQLNNIISMICADSKIPVPTTTTTTFTTTVTTTTSTSSAAPLSECKIQVDVAFIVDMSNSVVSVMQEDRIKMIDFIINLALMFPISKDQVHFSYFPYGTDMILTIPDQFFDGSMNSWPSPDKQKQEIFLRKMIVLKSAGFSRTWEAAAKARNVIFTQEKGMRNGVKKVIVLFTDGNPSLGTQDPAKEWELVKNKGIQVIIIGIGKKVNRTNLELWASSNNSVFSAATYKEAEAFMLNIGDDVCKPSKVPTTVSTFTKAVITTTPSQSVCQRQLNIILVIDASSSSKDLWVTLKSFLINFINEFNVSQVAAVKYASFATTEFEFLLEKQAVLDAIEKMETLDDANQIDVALQHVYKNLIKTNENRGGVPYVILLFTFGKSAVDNTVLYEAAKPLRQSGVYIVAVGLGEKPLFSDLLSITNNKESVFQIKNITTDDNYLRALSKNICNSPLMKSGWIEEHRGYLYEPTIMFTFDLNCIEESSSLHTIYDESRWGNDGTITDHVTIDSTRPHCLTKLTMNDPGALILNGSSFRNKPVDGITIAAWLDLQPVRKIHTIFSVKNADGITLYELEVHSSGAIHFFIKYENKTVFGLRSSIGVFMFDNWTHLAVTYDLDDNKGYLYLNGIEVEPRYLTISAHEVDLLPGDWNGYVGIGKDKPESSKQLTGSIDEFYLFPGALDADDIINLKGFCGRYKHRILTYSGILYELYEQPSSMNVSNLKAELQDKQSFYRTIQTEFIAPIFPNSSSISNTRFAAKLSGYFVPPISSEYTFQMEGDGDTALFMNIEKPSVYSETVQKLTTFDFSTKKETFKVILKPGNRYYIELYQLSTNQQNALKLGYETRCPDKPYKLLISELTISKANVIYDIPKNCTVISNYIHGAPDDQYSLRLSTNCDVISMYCYNMSKYKQYVPKEYLTLTSGPEKNYASFYRPRLVNFNTCQGDVVNEPVESEKRWGKTWFRRVHVNTSDLIIRNDFQFAYSEGKEIAYGSAGDCYSKSSEDCRQGQFSIDLSNTGAHIRGDLRWVPTGYPDNMFERITNFKASPDGKTISANCGGSCADCEPETKTLRILPDICSSTSVGTKKNKIHHPRAPRKHKRSRLWWHFW